MATKKKQDHVRPTMPTVTIRGVEYELKPLPASMAYDFMPLLEQGMGAFLQLEAGRVTKEQVIVHMLGMVRRNRDIFDGVFAQVLGVKPKDFNNGEKFPLGTHFKLCRVLGDHPDFEDCFVEARELWMSMPSGAGETEQTTSDEPSASSERPEGTPDGATISS